MVFGRERWTRVAIFGMMSSLGESKGDKAAFAG
jgi:hypothetical protein